MGSTRRGKLGKPRSAGWTATLTVLALLLAASAAGAQSSDPYDQGNGPPQDPPPPGPGPGEGNQTSGNQTGEHGQGNQTSGNQTGEHGQGNQTSGNQTGEHGHGNQTSGNTTHDHDPAHGDRDAHGNRTGNATGNATGGDHGHTPPRPPPRPAVLLAPEVQAAKDAVYWGELLFDAQQRLSQHARRAGLFTPLEASIGQAGGAFARFDYREDQGSLGPLRNLANGTTFLQGVAVQPWTQPRNATVVGAVFHMTSDNASITFHHTPATPLEVRGVEAQAVFTLAEDVRTEALQEGRLLQFRLDRSGARAFLLATGDAHLERGNGTVTAHLDDGAALFLADPGGALLGGNLSEARARAAAAGVLGGELDVVAPSVQPVQHGLSLGVRMHVARVTPEAVDVVLSSDARGGRVVVVRIDHASLPAPSARHLLVTLDGREAERVGEASELLQRSPGASEAARSAVRIADGVIEVAVAVPGFSDRMLRVEQVEEPVEVPEPEGADGQGDADADTGEADSKGLPGAPGVAVLGSLVAGALLKARCAPRARRFK